MLVFTLIETVGMVGINVWQVFYIKRILSSGRIIWMIKTIKINKIFNVSTHFIDFGDLLSYIVHRHWQKRNLFIYKCSCWLTAYYLLCCIWLCGIKCWNESNLSNLICEISLQTMTRIFWFTKLIKKSYQLNTILKKKVPTGYALKQQIMHINK